MNRYTALVSASLTLAAFVGGCQHSGTAENTADTNRPTMASEKTVYADPALYTVPYTATTDASWMHTATDTTSAGTLKTGDTVWLRSDTPTTGVVSAKTADGKIVYVRAGDLKAK